MTSEKEISTWFLETFANFRAGKTLKNLQVDIIHYVFSFKM